MKKILKILGYTLLAIVAVLGLGATYIQVRGIPDYEYAPTPEIVQMHIPAGDTVRIERGKKIASMLCKACHMGEDGKLSGNILKDAPEMLGVFASLNITKDSVHGIGTWSDGELYYFLRTGIRKDGSYAPVMPQFDAVADEDLKSVIAWLRSDDPDLEPSSREYPPNQWNFLMKFLVNSGVMGAAELPKQPIFIPDSTNKVALGEYLADRLIACYGCHSGDFTKMDTKVPSNSYLYYGGGNPMLNKEGEVVRSANLTPHPVYGIGRLTEQQFIDAVRFGKKPGGGQLAYPMMPHSALTDDETKAIFAYLKTIPALDHKVDRYQPGKPK